MSSDHAAICGCGKVTRVKKGRVKGRIFPGFRARARPAACRLGPECAGALLSVHILGGRWFGAKAVREEGSGLAQIRQA